MSEEARALIVAGVTGPFAIFVDRVVSGYLGRRKDNAVADLTIGQSWQEIVGELRTDIGDLRDRVKALEDERQTLLNRVKGLIAEVDHYRRVARSMARHVLRLRDALAAAGADVPTMPEDVEDALTVIDIP